MSISAGQKARLGGFLVIGLAAAAVMIAIPLGARFNDKSNIFYAFFSGESLSGLEEGAQVKFHGVPIGKVEKITYDLHELTRVKTVLKVQGDFPMKTDMHAEAGAMGITGLKYIEVLGGTNEAPMLKPGSEIPTKTSAFTAITGKAESIVAKMEILLNHLNELSDPDSLASLKLVLGNLKAITGDARDFFARVGPDARGVASSLHDLAGRLDSISCDVKVVTSSVSQQVSGPRIANILSSVDSTSRALKTLSESLALMIKQGHEDYSVSMQNLRSALENANNLMQELAENPSLLLRSESPKGREGQ